MTKAMKKKFDDRNMHTFKTLFLNQPNMYLKLTNGKRLNGKLTHATKSYLTWESKGKKHRVPAHRVKSMGWGNDI